MFIAGECFNWSLTVIATKKTNEVFNQTVDIYRTVAEIAGLGYILWDEVYESCLEYSDVILQLHNLSSEDYLDRISQEKGMLHVVEDDLEKVQLFRKNCRLHQESNNIRYRIECDNGTVKWVHEITRPGTVQNGKVLTSIRSMRDITNDVLEREMLEREKFFIQQVEKVTGVGVFVWDVETQKNIYCSENLANLHGMKMGELEEIVGSEEGDVDLAYPADRERLAIAYEKSRISGEPIDIEYRYNHPERGIVWFHEVAFRRILGVEKREVTMGLLHDITEKKQIEDQVLEQRLVAAEATRVSKVKSDFLANMSHELRTPLNAVLGFGQLLLIEKENTMSSSQKDYVQSILSGGNHLLEMVNQVLDLAQIEAEKITFTIEPVLASHVIVECINMVEPIGFSKDIKFKNNIDINTKIYVSVDKLRLKQVFVNLLSNAVKYNKINGTVTISSDIIDNKYMKLIVNDTGIGISDIDKSKVFEMFNRIGANPLIAQEGSGIGLSVSKLLIEQMECQIGFESELGVGSTFWINLPLSPE